MSKKVLYRSRVVAAALVLGVATPWAISPGEQKVVVPMVQLPCRVLSVHDGDTMTVEIVTVVNVRLLDCWAPELSQVGGPESRDHLRQLAAVGSKGIITVPIHDNLSKSWTFGRLLGSISLEGSGDLADAQVGTGHATVKKLP